MPRFHYQQIAEQLIERMQSGHYPLGKKLPSIRELSHQFSVSKGTIVRCYEALEDQGWIQPKEKSGFFPTGQHHPLLNKTTLSAIQPRRLDNKSLGISMVRAASVSAQVPFGSAHPEVMFPAVKQLYQCLKKQAGIEGEQLEQGVLPHYQTPPGDEQLCMQLSLYLAEKGIVAAPESILVTNGTQAAIALALEAVTETNDIVLVESPCFYGTLQCLEAMRRKVVEIPQAPEGGPNITLVQAALERWPVKAMLLNPTVNNPTGLTMPELARHQLIELANRYDLALIEDDVFADLHFQAPAPSPLKMLDTENRVMYCGSISKFLTPKLRIGWLLAGRWHEACQHLLFVTHMGLPSHSQKALAQWLATGKLNRHLRQIRKVYQQRLSDLLSCIADSWPAEVQVQQPSGGFLLWLKLPEGCEALQLYQWALDQKISITPGPLFSGQEAFPNYLRLNYAFFRGQPEYTQSIYKLGQQIKQQYTNAQASTLGEIK
ncbi:transcriptional regulator, GntR family [Oceanospirillum multiglobuliferum]|uniref:HTH gntR-type domain-containing protein n=1 Tax=Oceanospirillum multiglobuliferum TaxID=64969 RepID=A0A1T4SM63_9GAMM|nr:PLP-dependent aminotransferase family protein [Oceanospirillum multiglobuliferum]OPX54191.1 hypothetical protein BTE48_15455 [Oceanospirillum multiglobuliferum]SKA28941.1 transcriptional regulator, GntR family [Oceanospirillum multiglobuliferum]